MCGENGVTFQLRDSLKGSPPRVRGKRNGGKRIDHVGRITPACAGKTQQFLPLFQVLQDHPRVCGENFQRSK